MSVEEISLSSARDVIKSALPEAVYLFSSFTRLKERKFSAISERGTLYRRATVTTALALICGFATYLVLSLDPFADLTGVMGPIQRGAWAALTPLIAMPPLYALLKWHSKERLASTFLNLGLVTATALMVAPSVLLTAGVELSMLGNDMRALRAGHGAGTPVHDVFCGSVEDRARMLVTMNAMRQIGPRLQRNTNAQLRSMREQAEIQRIGNAQAQELLSARRAGRPAGQLAAQLFATAERGMAATERAQDLIDESLALNRQNLMLLYRSLEIQRHLNNAPLRLIAAYPVAAVFLAVAVFFGVLIWAAATVMIWRLIVTPLSPGKSKLIARVTVTLVLLVFFLGFSILRSGMLEILLGEPPSQDTLLAQTRSQFETVAPICRELDNYKLW
ncbi:MAG: hypothetical protein QOK17_2682 [Sphingomonadales bacterium]|jgi:hypothetical protein|nr:hypothetical protein [Sphingomonadales bacterium]